jgi:hypothetical protein
MQQANVVVTSMYTKDMVILTVIVLRSAGGIFERTMTAVLATMTDVPTTITAVPPTKTDDPTTTTAVLSTMTDVPTTNTDVPSTMTAAPATTTAVPTTTTAVPTTITAVPTTMTAVPTTMTNVPTALTDATTTAVTTTITDDPTTTSDIPSTAAVSTITSAVHVTKLVPTITRAVPENIALNLNTGQSATWYNGYSYLAVDGYKETTLFIHDNIYQCQHTTSTYNPWWYVDFGSIKMVRIVKVLNRGDCCGDRLKFVYGYVSSDKGNPLQSIDKQLCFYYSGPAANGEELAFTCPSSITGR